jgi:protein-S-isoprenylcysteine O-methyltransferase Ste14
MVTGVIPAIILYRSWWSLPPWRIPGFLVGCGLIALGLLLMWKTIRLFRRVGKGTLAPWNPTQRLVVCGVYRHVRNPMISGVLCILLGEVVLFGSFPLFVWFILFLGLNMTYLPLIEEPGLEARFGDEYRYYRSNVPRWLPRVRPWTGRFEGQSTKGYGE